MGHVANIIGGYDTQELHGGQSGVRFKPLAKERQTAAVEFLQKNAFWAPKWMLSTEILRRLEPNGEIERVRAAQQRVLTNMLSPMRLSRLSEQEAIDGAKAYTLSAYLADVRKGIYSELGAAQVSIGTFRRNTQRVYLENVNDKLNGRTPASDDTRAMLRAELRSLNADITAALGKTTDRATRAHLDDVKDQIGKILDPKFQAPAPAVAAPVATRGVDDPWALDCWRDFNVFALERNER